MRHTTSNIFISLLILSLSSAAFSAPGPGSVYLEAGENSWVGGNLPGREISGAGTMSSYDLDDYGIDIQFGGFGLHGGYWTFSFAAPAYNVDTGANTGNRLEPGIYSIVGSIHSNEPTEAGMSISGNGRGNSQLNGWFHILEVEYDERFDGVTNLAVDFRQYEGIDTSLDKSIFGSLRFRSDIPLNYTGEQLSAVPVPATAWLFGSALIFIVRIKRKK